MPKLIANALLFQLGWLACVLGGGPWLLLVALAVAVHLLWTASWAAEGKLLFSVFLAGSALDSFLLNLGVFDFGEPRTLIPLWLALLWLLLATTLNHCLAWTAQPWWRGSLLGAVGGPLSYYAGAQLADVTLPYGTWPTLALVALIWALVMPVLHGFARLYRSQYQQSLRARRSA
ncbi:DUF2878 domain-containing protein [Pseudomonas sp. LPB0260]|uniref:DUF2878 domain-containing protein n=1 Tax=Pseudomonas sp. LPB0260 TaxID=2614442 RepID=UPI0015C22457|nr:DUF2878 domain-containing protein [Pseudomonas sp. LPB0260]QLC73867.1 DUF2878 domain-containing protein [Pseudomonas sp. LPB0260]QLC76641.1 DUF2878 domain-containing protein [Pseudomonas sp. LPB0260]